MNLKPIEIFAEYQKGTQFKAAIGTRGLFEQSKINARFFVGDQWYGANCGTDKPLVRHNVIKRIGDYKMSQILNDKTAIGFSAEGIPTAEVTAPTEFSGPLSDTEISAVMTALDGYYSVTCERINFPSLSASVLKNAYISGTALLYTYWNPVLSTGTFADSKGTQPIKGDISCEILRIEDVVFGDPYCEELQNQPYVIISAKKNVANVVREARLYGADLSTLTLIEESAIDGKVEVLTRLYKTINKDGSITVKGIKATSNAIVRSEFSTGLRLYPLAQLKWETMNFSAYGESEITYLIPNQIAINRLITANVWSEMSTGLPIMLVNGDTVNEKITNDPGQIVKIYGSNEDVAGAVKYVTPPSYIKEFDDSINTLINNTLTQSGANEVALGDSKADNATALITMRDAALMPLNIVKNRYYVFLEDVARIWADFWITHYGKRSLKLKNGNEITYIPFDGERYKKLIINAKIDVIRDTVYTEKEQLDTLLTLFDKGIITKAELLDRIPKGLVANSGSISREEKENDRL
ncbi:MAG: hypothetical protein IJO62_04370 [Clostridia bacterium]|nr:hypothetical protein [Clostridia bacterium]